MPRKRKFASNAERQRYYRERKKRNAPASALPPPEAGALRKSVLEDDWVASPPGCPLACCKRSEYAALAEKYKEEPRRKTLEEDWTDADGEPTADGP